MKRMGLPNGQGQNNIVSHIQPTTHSILDVYERWPPLGRYTFPAIFAFVLLGVLSPTVPTQLLSTVLSILMSCT